MLSRELFADKGIEIKWVTKLQICTSVSGKKGNVYSGINPPISFQISCLTPMSEVAHLLAGFTYFS
jgi:hypothetical protein